MRRRSGGLGGFLDDLILCPWWVSVILAAAAFFALQLFLPLLAPIVAFILLMAAGLSFFNSPRSPRRPRSVRGHG